MNLRQRFSDWKSYRKLRHPRWIDEREDDLAVILIIGMLALHAWGRHLSSSLNDGLWWGCLGLALIYSALRLVRTLRT